MVRSYADYMVFQFDFSQKFPEEVLVDGRDYLGFLVAVAVVTRLVGTFKVNVKAVVAGQHLKQFLNSDFAVFFQVS